MHRPPLLKIFISGVHEEFARLRRDLRAFLLGDAKGLLEKIGKTGKGTHYLLNRKGLTKGSDGSRSMRGT